MTEKDFKKVLTTYEHPAIIVYITASGELKLQTSADLELSEDMLIAAANFINKSVEVELLDGNTEFVSNGSLH